MRPKKHPNNKNHQSTKPSVSNTETEKTISHATNAQVAPHNPGEAIRERDKPMSRYEKATLAVTVVGIAIAAAVLLVYIGQLSAARQGLVDNKDALILSNRAYVCQKRATLFHTTSVDGEPTHAKIVGSTKQPIRENEAPALEVSLVNSGNTPANQVSTYGVATFMAGLPYNVDNTATKLQSVAVLAKDADTPVQPPVWRFTGDQIRELESGKKTLALAGYVTYDDVFGIHRKSTFCTYYDKLSFEMVACPFYNRCD
jgi:hypothetical protein